MSKLFFTWLVGLFGRVSEFKVNGGTRKDKSQWKD